GGGGGGGGGGGLGGMGGVALRAFGAVMGDREECKP
ncbi:dicarboxylate/amino acid:cation symporter, partial [Pseudomonas fluorescens]